MSDTRRRAWYASGFALLCVFVAWASGGSEESEEESEEPEEWDTGYLPSDAAYEDDLDTGDTGLVTSEAMATGAYVGLGRGRTGTRWRTGTTDGEVKSSNPEPDDYEVDRAAYSGIDTRQVGRTSGSFGLGVLALFIPRVSDLINRSDSPAQPSQWDDLADLMTDKYSAPVDSGDPDSGDFPEIVAAHLEEPKGEEVDTDDPTPIELWEADYRGEDSGGPYDYNRSFNYFETNSWVNDWDKDWFVDMLENTALYTDGILGGRYPLAHWEIAEGDGLDYGEHADRLGIDEYYDANETLYDASDDFTLFFFYPYDRESDAIPGWYQRYTFDGEFDFSDPGAPSELAFEAAYWGCVGCDGGTDMILEFSWESTDPLVVDSGSEFLEMDDTSAGLHRLLSSWSRDEGTYTFAVTMYSVDRPFAARHGFFRLIDESSETYGDSTDWVYETGIWVDGTFDVPLAFALDDFNSANDPGAAEQALDITDCLWLFWTDPTNAWVGNCDTIFTP